MQADAAPAPSPAFDALDACHRQSIVALGRLAALVHRLDTCGADEHARELARQVILHFALASRRHHAEEERLVFPALVAHADPELVQQVLRLQQDHCWLEEDWMEIEPHLQAIVHAQGWWDSDALRAGAEVFSALSLGHIALEESVIYPEARARLSAAPPSDMHALEDVRSARKRRVR